MGRQQRTQVRGHGGPRCHVRHLLGEAAAAARDRLLRDGSPRQLGAPPRAQHGGRPGVGARQQGQYTRRGADAQGRRKRGHARRRQGDRGGRADPTDVHDGTDVGSANSPRRRWGGASRVTPET